MYSNGDLETMPIITRNQPTTSTTNHMVMCLEEKLRKHNYRMWKPRVELLLSEWRNLEEIMHGSRPLPRTKATLSEWKSKYLVMRVGDSHASKWFKSLIMLEKSRIHKRNVGSVEGITPPKSSHIESWWTCRCVKENQLTTPFVLSASLSHRFPDWSFGKHF